ncbi:DUF2190 family protein [Spongiibacter sp. KMU-166]|uniref:DUF2190 family protein n=1 Tax=Spongiibacter thalassae TaxID=2721624 RepID=A0ABX1GE19_9GAMM|nr:capsid cement protein [Spongiibacter thalassae]NKI17432.1 DUF2190 family protein [Spongiibacter thalassae]
MKNYVQKGEAITVTAPAALVSGQGVLVGEGLFGVAVNAAESGSEVTIITEGVFELPADATVAAGDVVEWNTGEALPIAAGVRIGVALTASTNGLAQVKIG